MDSPDAVVRCETLTNKQLYTIVEWMVAEGDSEKERRERLEERVAGIPLVSDTLELVFELGFHNLEALRREMHAGFIELPIEVWCYFDFDQFHSAFDLDTLRQPAGFPLPGSGDYLESYRFSSSIEMLRSILGFVYKNRNFNESTCRGWMIEIMDYYGYYPEDRVFENLWEFWHEFGYEGYKCELFDQVAYFLVNSESLPVSLHRHIQNAAAEEVQRNGLVSITMHDIYRAVCDFLDVNTYTEADLSDYKVLLEFSRAFMKEFPMKTQ